MTSEKTETQTGRQTDVERERERERESDRERDASRCKQMQVQSCRVADSDALRERHKPIDNAA